MLGRFTGQLDAWVLAEGIERMAELESLIRLPGPARLGLPAGDAMAAAARWFDADHELDVVVVLDDWSRPVGLVDRASAAGNGQPKRTVLKTRPSAAPDTVVARAMPARPPAGGRADEPVGIGDGPGGFSDGEANHEPRPAKERTNVTVTRLEVRQPAPGPGRPQRSQQARRPRQARRSQRPQEAERSRETQRSPREREGREVDTGAVAPAKPLSRTARRAAAEDAKLLAAIRVLLSNPSLFPRAVYVAFGFAAITSLGVALTGAVPLPYGFHYAVIPAYAVMALLGLRYPAWGKRALLGLLAGMIATGVYDILRIGLMFAGLWGDPIPSIGRLALNDPGTQWYWGYVWRFVGNGGGMGIAFAMLPWRGVKLGIAYGSAVCLGLVGLLYFWPVSQQHFFALTPATAAGGMAGHWVYGAVLGGLTARWLPPVGRRRRSARDRRDRRDRDEDRAGARQREATVLVAVPDQPEVGGHGAIAGGPDLTLPGGRLSSDELYAVKCSLQQPPRAHGFASDHWNLRRVAMVVERATGVRGWQPAELLGLLEALDLDLHLREQREQRDQPREQGARRGARTTLVS